MRTVLPLVTLLALACAGGGETGDDPTDTEPSDSEPGTDTEPEVDTEGEDTDAAGCEGVAWYEVFGETATDEAWGVGTLPGGDVVFAAHQGNPTLADGYVRRYTPEGALVWESSWGEAYTEQLFVVEEHGGVLYVGGTQFRSFGLYDTAALLLTLDPDTGAVLDVYQWDTEGWDEIDGLHVDDDGVFLTGWAQGASGTWDARAVRLTHDLEEVWSTDLDVSSGGIDGANGHLVRIGEVVYFAGHADYSFSTDTFLAAVDAGTGASLWTRVEDDGGTHTEALGLTSDGERLYGVGEGQVDGDGQVLLWAWELDGTPVWSTSWGPEGADVARAIRVWGDRLLVAANGSGQVSFVQVDPDSGAATTLTTWGGAGVDVAHDFVIDGARLYVALESSSFGAGDLDAVVLAGCLDPLLLPEPS